MNYILYSIAIILIFANTVNTDLKVKIKSDETLIIPGFGAENILLDDASDEIISLKGYPDRVCEFEKAKEFFKDIYNLESPQKIFFNKIFHFIDINLIILIHENVVSAIIGLSSSRITVDFVNLSKGVEHFLFTYGNKDLNVLTKNDNKFFIYSKLGFAVADDKSDDVIDMYLIFSKKGKN